jgi:hypothetical protein
MTIKMETEKSIKHKIGNVLGVEMGTKSSIYWLELSREGLEGYEINNIGELKDPNSKLIHPELVNGYIVFKIIRDEKTTVIRRDGLLARTFIPGYSLNTKVIHINGKRDDDDLHNLAWEPKKSTLIEMSQEFLNRPIYEMTSDTEIASMCRSIPEAANRKWKQLDDAVTKTYQEELARWRKEMVDWERANRNGNSQPKPKPPKKGKVPRPNDIRRHSAKAANRKKAYLDTLWIFCEDYDRKNFIPKRIYPSGYKSIDVYETGLFIIEGEKGTHGELCTNGKYGLELIPRNSETTKRKIVFTDLLVKYAFGLPNERM